MHVAGEVSIRKLNFAAFFLLLIVTTHAGGGKVFYALAFLGTNHFADTGTAYLCKWRSYEKLRVWIASCD
jgi:hypothetical protein